MLKKRWVEAKDVSLKMDYGQREGELGEKTIPYGENGVGKGCSFKVKRGQGEDNSRRKDGSST
jgi:hypothetical protein